jgi:hypothetical protein
VLEIIIVLIRTAQSAITTVVTGVLHIVVPFCTLRFCSALEHDSEKAGVTRKVSSLLTRYKPVHPRRPDVDMTRYGQDHRGSERRKAPAPGGVAPLIGRTTDLSPVMAGLVPAIHVFLREQKPRLRPEFF